MENIFLYIIIGIVFLNTILIAFCLLKKTKIDTSDLLQNVKNENEHLEKSMKNNFELLLSAIKNYFENISNFLTNLLNNQSGQLGLIENRLNEILKDNDFKLTKITEVLNQSLKDLLQNNEKKLEQMRQTVDEKLSSTLDKRLGESVSKITEGLEVVSKGIGEMQSLANGVGDLKRVLTNVKTRGGWGEVQLSSLLDQILSKSQYREQVQIKKNSQMRVDFAVVLPGKSEDKELLLPIDAKFPLEDYSRLCSALEQNNIAEVDKQSALLERRIKEEAKSIYEKYIDPPTTTDFAVMYLPVEGLYAEVIRRPALVEYLQTSYKIMVCGPTTLTALLNSLQMGFKTLAIEKRSSEIYKTLTIFKGEFNKFFDLLSTTQKKIEEASNSLESATKKSITIQKKLDTVASIEYEKEEDE